MPPNAADVSKRVHDIFAYLDQRVADMYGTNELPDEGSKLLTVRFDAEDEIDLAAVRILESRGLAKWVNGRGIGDTFEVEASAAIRTDGAGGQTKATLALAARMDALEGAIEQLVSQNERLLEAVAAPKALPAAKKKAKAAKKGGRRG